MQSNRYVFTLTCTRTAGTGRFFITPSRPAPPESDVGQLRVRLVLVSEPELRRIASGTIEPGPRGFFNERHEGRWRVLVRLGELFVRQLEEVTGEAFFSNSRKQLDWGRNLCGRIKRAQGEGLETQDVDAPDSPMDPHDGPEDNCFLRIHIPYPGGTAVPALKAGRKCADVVVYS